jgi:hypothetical protein
MPQWSSPVEIPNQTSKTSPSLAVYNGRLHMLHLDESSDDVWHSIYDGNAWSPNQRTGAQSGGPVAFAEGGLAIFSSLAGPGVFKYSRYLSGWTPPSRLGGVVNVFAPALTLTPSGWLLVCLSVLDHALSYAYYAASGQGVQVTSYGDAPQYSKAAPALAAHTDGLHMVYRGENNKRLYHSIYR